MKTHDLKTQFFERRPVKQTPVVKKAVSAPHTPPYRITSPNAPEEIWLPAPKPSKQWKRPSLKPILLGFTLAVAIIMLITLGGGGVILYNSPLIMPGVSVLGTNLGQLTKAEAATVLQTEWTQRQITLTADKTSLSVHPSELGISFDITATVERIHQQGRDLASWQAFFANDGALSIQPVWEIDMGVAETYLQQTAPIVANPAQNATIDIVNGQVHTIPAISGTELDTVETVAWLAQNGATVVLDGNLPLITNAITPDIINVSAIAEQAQQLLTTSVAIEAYDPVADTAVSWTVTPAMWGDWLTLDINAADQTSFTWTLDNERAGQFLDLRTAALGGNQYLDHDVAVTAVAEAIKTQQPAISLRLYHHNSDYIVQTGDTFASIGRDMGIPYPWIQAANPTIGDALNAGQSLIIPSPDVMLPLPIVQNKRIVVSISQQKVWVYEDGTLKWEWLGSTGIASSPTAPGVFQIQTHEINAYAGNWNLWMPNFMGIYSPVPNADFMNGFHGFPTRDGSNLLWTNNLGTPVTDGCVL
ncbi:MAG: L,D-transpeptidase family protein [Chloroflexi bacterium]|nr:L,D-transpeptidase family protein [Chloroflexota bacterium]